MSRERQRKLSRAPTTGANDSLLNVDDIVTNKDTPQSQLDHEKQALHKEHRVNDRLMKQLEEAALRSASLEAQFRVKERLLRDKEAAIEAQMLALQSEQERERTSVKAEIEKLQKKIEFKEKAFQEILDTKLREHNKLVQSVKLDTEELKKSNLSGQARELELTCKREQSEKEELDSQNRKLQSNLDNLQADLQKENQNIEALKQSISDCEQSNSKLKESNAQKSKFESELKQLTKQIDSKEKDQEQNKDLSDQIIELRTQIKSQKSKHDDMVITRERLEVNLTRAKSGASPVESRHGDKVSRLANVEKTSAYDKYAGRSRDRSAPKEDSSKADARNDEKKIAELKMSIKTLTREKEREIEQLEKQATTAEAAAAKTETAHIKLEAQQKDIQKLITQDKEMAQSRMNVLKERHQFLMNRSDIVTNELKKQTKYLEDGEFNLSEKKRVSDDLKKQIDEKKGLFEENDMNIKQKQRTLERVEKELKQETKTYQDTKDKLTDTKAALELYTQILAETREEFKRTRKDRNLELHALESEIYTVTVMKESLLHVIDIELTKELNDLKWYLKPLREKEVEESRLYGTVTYDFLMARRATRKEELEAIKKAIEDSSLDHVDRNKTPQDFKKALDFALSQMEADERTDLLFEMRDLTEAMKLAQFKQRTILQVVSLLAAHEVYPGAIRELSVLTRMIKELHVMQRPEMLLKTIYKEFIRDSNAKSFRRRLLERLVHMRMKRTGKTYEQCQDFIFYGVERAEDEILEEKEQLNDSQKQG